MGEARILLVEADDQSRINIARSLIADGHMVVGVAGTAADTEDVLSTFRDAYRDNQPNLVIVDGTVINDCAEGMIGLIRGCLGNVAIIGRPNGRLVPGAGLNISKGGGGDESLLTCIKTLIPAAR
jgi:DNA-binding NarL/FixJ family response regulator